MTTVQLRCRPNKVENTLVFPYRIENHGDGDIYVMDAQPTTRSDQGANEQAGVVMLGPGDDAVLGKFLAPLPTDRRVAFPAFPLARQVRSGEAFEGHLKLPMPLAETSPYFGDLPLRQYDIVDIKGAVFVIGYWFAGRDGLAALPLDHSPGLFRVVTRDTRQSAAYVFQRFPATGLQLFKRKDAFPRTFAEAPGCASLVTTPLAGAG